MPRGGSSAQRVCLAARCRGTRGGEPCVRRAREREGRLREEAVGVTVIDSCSGGSGGGQLLLLRRARECACVSARER